MVKKFIIYVSIFTRELKKIDNKFSVLELRCMNILDKILLNFIINKVGYI